MNPSELSEQEQIRRNSMKALRDMGIDAAIAGKAVYSGALDLPAAVQLAR